MRVPLRFERVTDTEGARLLCSVEAAASALDHPGLLADTVQDVAGLLPDGTPSERLEFEVVYDGDDVVACTFLSLPTKENTHLGNANVTVVPSARRQGIGRAAAERLVARARDEGRKLLVNFIGAPLGSVAPGDALAASLGAAPALESIRRELDARSIDDAMLDGFVEHGVGDRAKGYEVVQWVDHAPDALVDRAAALLPLVFSDSPRGDLEFDDEVWDAARVREFEDMIHRRGRTNLVTGAVDQASGKLVAYTEITVPRTRLEQGAQWGTIVDRDHRGHRLGLLVKAENLRQLRRTYPETESVVTWNASENGHMISVNEDLGFRAAERYQAWQLTL